MTMMIMMIMMEKERKEKTRKEEKFLVHYRGIGFGTREDECE